jgi:fructose-1,6-bisphosphatase/inositol monophosphatase family enzyme
VHTDDDARAGQALHELFTASFPGHGLTIEDRPSLPGDGVHEWFLDPIDGSANHLRGIPYVALSAGLALDGEPVVGVIHDLVRKVTLSAHRGGGARVHDHGRVRPVRVAPTERLVDAMTIVHLARRGPLLGLEGALAHLLWNIRKVRCMGSIALDLALIANGEADLLVTGRGTPQRLLDILGGLVIVAEAGGRVADADGRPWRGASRTLVAGPSALVDAFVALMADWDLEGWSAARAVPPGPRSPA